MKTTGILIIILISISKLLFHVHKIKVGKKSPENLSVTQWLIIYGLKADDQSDYTFPITKPKQVSLMMFGHKSVRLSYICRNI